MPGRCCGSAQRGWGRRSSNGEASFRNDPRGALAALPDHPDRADPHWADWYAQEESLLRRVLPEEYALRITHIGSTAIPGIWAKPIVDILVEAAPGTDLTGADKALSAAGFRCMERGDARRSYIKGYTETGFAEQVFHLHLQHATEDVPDEVRFRDWLIAHPKDATAYEALKLRLREPFRHDRDGYTAAKTGFVQEVLRRSRADG